MAVLAFAPLGSTSACVIPLAPEFQDPEDNYPPFVLSADPPEGTRISPAEVDRPIKITLGDQNLSDTLFARWIYDYPVRDPALTRFGQEDEIARSGTVTRRTIQLEPSCLRHNIARGPLQHRLTLSVSDRPFLDPDKGETVSPLAPLDSPRDGAHRVRITWVLELECKS
jgi:hypothetical protein